jgi:hypothetical protein
VAKKRPKKVDQLIYADVTDSKAKAGVWFGETTAWKRNQKSIMAALRDRISWVNLPGAILAISDQPVGVVLIAPNPSLPGIFVVADGTTKTNTAKLQSQYSKLVAGLTKDQGIAPIVGRGKKR